MTVAELIKALEAMRAKHGNLEVMGVWDDCQWDVDSVYLGGKDRPFITDPTSPVILIDVDGGQDRERREIKG